MYLTSGSQQFSRYACINNPDGISFCYIRYPINWIPTEKFRKKMVFNMMTPYSFIQTTNPVLYYKAP